MLNILQKSILKMFIIVFEFAEKMNKKSLFALAMNSLNIKSCRLNLLTLQLFFNFMLITHSDYT